MARNDMLWKTLANGASTQAKMGRVRLAAEIGLLARQLAGTGGDAPTIRIRTMHVTLAHRLRDLGRYADLSVTVIRSVGTDAYDATAFSFATKLLDGTAYQVSVKTAPAGQTCSVYKGAIGTLPVATDALRVGCEYTYDHVSRSTDDAVLGTYFESSAPVIGGSSTAVGATADGYGEGRFVAFVSSAAGIGGATSAHRQVFWRDRLTGQTLLVSTNAAAAEGDGDSFAPAISADGLTVAFESYASNLVTGDANGVRDMVVWSALRPADGVARVSVGAGGVEANAESYEPTLSGDGKVVAFSSGASNLTAGVVGTSTIT